MMFQFIICFFVFIFDTNNKEIKKELRLILNLKSVPVNILTPLNLEVFKRTEILEMKYGVLWFIKWMNKIKYEFQKISLDSKNCLKLVHQKDKTG
jgi:hypothetical protein